MAYTVGFIEPFIYFRHLILVFFDGYYTQLSSTKGSPVSIVKTMIISTYDLNFSIDLPTV